MRQVGIHAHVEGGIEDPHGCLDDHGGSEWETWVQTVLLAKEGQDQWLALKRYLMLESGLKPPVGARR